MATAVCEVSSSSGISVREELQGHGASGIWSRVFGGLKEVIKLPCGIDGR